MMKIKQLLLPLMAGMGSFMFNPSAEAQEMSMQNTKSAMSFVENKGQITDQFYEHRPDIDFKLAAGNGLNIFFGKGKIHYQWSENIMSEKENKGIFLLEDENTDEPAISKVEMYRMDVELLNSNPNPTIIKEGKKGFFERYFLSWVNKDNSNDGVKAHAYEKIIYKDVYPNIDWVFYVNARQQVEHDFIVYPGGKVEDIQLQYNGSIALSLEKDGSLLATTPKGTIKENAPYSFDESGSEVTSAFKLQNQILSFEVGEYIGILTIDPILEWGTYFGGSDDEKSFDLSMDKYGDIYMAGGTNSTSNIATTGAHQTIFQGGSSTQGGGEAFLSKWNTDGDLIWATYYGGEGVDVAKGVACDTSGNVYLGGYTESEVGISTTSAHQEDLNGWRYDAFIVKFDSAGTREWGTYFGGSGQDANKSFALTVDELDKIYITGSTQSTDLPTTTAAHQDTRAGGYDIFLAKFDVNGDLDWSTYYGGTDNEYADAITTDLIGNIYITGYTKSTSGISTFGIHQEVHGGNDDAFLAKFDDLGNLIFGTYLGGDNVDRSESVALHEDKIIIGGFTMSQSGISTSNAFKEIADPTPFVGEAFLAVFNELGTIEWATYYGGDNYDMITSIVVKDEYIYIYGETSSEQEISTIGAHQEDLTGSQNAFLAKFDFEGNRIWGTYYGGNNLDYGRGGIFIDPNYNIYFSGQSNSANGISTTGGYQENLNGGHDAFLVKLNDCPSPLLEGQIIGALEICEFSLSAYEVGDAILAEEYVWILPNGWIGDSDSNEIEVTAGSNNGVLQVYALSSCGGISDTLSLEITVLPVPEPVIVNNNNILTTAQTYDTYQWMESGLDIPNATEAMFVADENGAYQVRVTADNDCKGISDEELIDGIGINDIDLSKLVSIYPNPVKDQLFVESAQNMDATIFSVDGRMVKEGVKITKGVNTINVQKLNAGIYFLSMKDEDGSRGVMKFIVE